MDKTTAALVSSAAAYQIHEDVLQFPHCGGMNGVDRAQLEEHRALLWVKAVGTNNVSFSGFALEDCERRECDT